MSRVIAYEDVSTKGVNALLKKTRELYNKGKLTNEEMKAFMEMLHTHSDANKFYYNPISNTVYKRAYLWKL